ncbi:MAG: hypothetical protein JST91_04230 [Actinobacteria bacterium]|nr:hypothetical protein [Actinomycetota bacterium]
MDFVAVPTDLVLAISITSTAVRWVVVEGTSGEGAPVERGHTAIEDDFDAGALLDGLLGADSAAAGGRMHAIGVTWAEEARSAADAVLDALAAWDLRSVVAVSTVEAAEALAGGIAAIAGYRDVAVCVVEPDVAVVATVRPSGVTVDLVDRPGEPMPAADVVAAVTALTAADGRHPDALFVVGSAALDDIVSALATGGPVPVISAAEADLAMARGAALASARAMTAMAAGAAHPRRRAASRVGALASVLAAAVVTFVVSVSVAVGLRITPDAGPQNAEVANAGEAAGVANLPSAPRAVPKPPPAAPVPVVPPPAAPAPVVPPPAAPAPVVVPPPAAEPPVAQTIAVAPPPVYVPPAPAPPAYVPPANVPPPPPPQPRLRDRIIERIPIINRFHEPQYPYP